MFETALLKSRPTRSRTPLLATAVGAHVLLLAGVVAAQYWKVDAVAEPQNLVDDVLVVNLPVPPPPARTETPRPKAATEAPQKHDVVPPTPVADTPPAPQQPQIVPDHVPPTPAEPQTGGDSSDSGPRIGTGGDTGSDGPTWSDGPIEIVAGITPPVAVTRIAPLYTESARRAHIQGVVVVEAVIDALGNVGNVKVLRGLGFGLDQNAADAVARWKFRPARSADGRSVAVYFRLTVDYHLN